MTAPNKPERYEVADGVEWVDGVKIKPGTKTVNLTEAQAKYDLALGRIKKPAEKSAPKKAPVETGDS